MKWLAEYWQKIVRTFFATLAVLFLLIESYEVITDDNIRFSFLWFVLTILILGIVIFFVDGLYVDGFLKKKIEIKNHGLDTKISVKFGDLFDQEGWKAVGVNDFFDALVDEDLISSKSIHGHVINTYWKNDHDDWQSQINSSLKGVQYVEVERPKGNAHRFPIGATGCATKDDNKFLFVALGKTDISNNVTTANGEILIAAIRGMLKKARSVCSYQPLSIPLMGAGLSRIGIKTSVLLDLIIVAILEESRESKITEEINVIISPAQQGKINLQNHIRNWN